MNAMISQLLHDIFSRQPGSAHGGKIEDAGNSGEADSYLYGDGMGWTCLTASLNCDPEQDLAPVCCSK